MDTILIPALNIQTHIGVYEWEQRILQTLLIDIEIGLDLSTCNNSLEKTVDYERLSILITEYVVSHTFQLIETVAEDVAKLVKEHFNVQKVTVCVQKPHAIKNAAPIKVIIYR